MPDIVQKINQDLIRKAKARDQLALDVLRMLKAAIKNKEIELKRELKSEELISLLRSQVKSRQDSVAQYKLADRRDLFEKEEKEILIIKEFLPAEMSEQKLTEVVQEVIRETKALSKADLGKIMPLAIKKTRGKAQARDIKDMALKLLP
ncbi:MAG: GatB/YqeY domain-containing protein [Patescibacteria group bacterium]|nr:GatB/YqeY domain-containing protein [Patescibacteria group bacterium]